MKSKNRRDPAQPSSEALQREWLRWLDLKWTQINREALAGRLKPPIFRIGWATERLGAWLASGRVLEIQGAHLAEDTAAEVEYTLRHEMAHQMVSEVFLSPGAQPHGALFIKACEILGIVGGPHGEIPQSQESERILRKARKLLSLASSSNTFEAATAMARAQELLGRYNLDLDSAGGHSSFGFRWLGKPQGRVPLERKLVAEIIQEFFFVRCVWIRTFQVTNKKNATLLETFGQAHNLEIANYVHDCLMRHLDELWRSHRRKKGQTKRQDRSAFRIGVIMGFRDHLASLVSGGDSTNLVWSGDPALQEFISARHPRLVRSSGGRYQPGDALEAGKREGKRLRIHPGVSSPGDTKHTRARLPRG